MDTPFLKLLPDQMAVNTLIVIVPQIIARRFSAASAKAKGRL